MQATEDFQQEVLNRLNRLDVDIKGLGDRIERYLTAAPTLKKQISRTLQELLMEAQS
jgi:archaellum component FlaC